MKGETDEEQSSFDRSGLSLGTTDNRKSFECDQSGSVTKKQFLMPVDLLESCLGSNHQNVEKVQDSDVPLDALKKAENSFDIQMIDDDDEEEDDDDDTGSVIEYDSSDSEEEEDSTSIADPPIVIVEEAEAKESEIEQKSEVSCSTMKGSLKSVLKKGTGRQNKGLKVTFHDTQIFLIDTDVEVSAGPQLLTVRSFDLPLALSDIRVFTPTFDFVPSLPPGSYDSNQHYTYEDAIVSFDDYDDVLVCRNEPSASYDVEGSKEVEEEEEATEVRNDESASNSDCQLIAALQQETVAENKTEEVATTSVQTETEESLIETSQSVERSVESVQSLTEANLKQHEILMEKDIIVMEDSVVPVSTTSTSAPIPTSTATTNGTSKLNSLSPPLKELTVDVQVVPGIEGLTDDWQVELSPLNSIPESETESSTSSQDTIIMMTSDESRRNEEHIQQSMDSFKKQKQDDNDVASTGSQDSDETLKQVEEPQRTSDQIRQILERNADRRNKISVSRNIKKKSVDGTPVEKQRQWRSHESLLDTIKKLTLDEEEETNEDTVDGSQPPMRSTDTSRQDNRKNLSKLSPQQVTDLIASPLGVQNLLRAKQATNDAACTKVAVPGDVRQWKIRSSLWNSIGSEDNRLWKKNTDSTSSLPYVNGHSNEYDSTNNNNGPQSCGYSVDDTSDELLQFVRQDSERIERIRKRYSYTDGDDYETVGSFARRSSVRGIKPRFGSTTEILKQMQTQLQPPPLSNPSNVGSHMTWPYPNTVPSRTSSSFVPQTSQSRFATRQTATTLPVLQEEIYGTTRTPSSQPRIPTYSVCNDYQPVYRTRRGRENCYGNYAQVSASGTHLLPPPYQPPPPPPPYQAPPPPPPSSQLPVHVTTNPSSPTRVVHVKDERGVPEGASSSPKVLFDSMYRQRHPHPNLHSVPQYSKPSMVGKDEQCHQQITDNTGCVYYVMQV